MTKSGYRVILANIKQSGDEKDPVTGDQIYKFQMKKAGQGVGLRADMMPDYTGASYCNDPDYFFRFNTSSLHSFLIGDSVTIIIEGGLAPYDWEVTDNANWVFSDAQTTLLSNVCSICPSATQGDSATLQVTDACGTIIQVVVENCTNPSDIITIDPDTIPIPDCSCPTNLAWDWDNSAETVAKSDSAIVYVTGGKSPFTWGGVLGTGFTLGESTSRSMTVTADATACGSCVIVATDSCGNAVSGSIRCTTGQWVVISVEYAGGLTSTTCPPSVSGQLPNETAYSLNYLGFNAWGLVNITGKYQVHEGRQETAGGSAPLHGCSAGNIVIVYTLEIAYDCHSYNNWNSSCLETTCESWDTIVDLSGSGHYERSTGIEPPLGLPCCEDVGGGSPSCHRPYRRVLMEWQC